LPPRCVARDQSSPVWSSPAFSAPRDLQGSRKGFAVLFRGKHPWMSPRNAIPRAGCRFFRVPQPGRAVALAARTSSFVPGRLSGCIARCKWQQGASSKQEPAMQAILLARGAELCEMGKQSLTFCGSTTLGGGLRQRKKSPSCPYSAHSQPQRRWSFHCSAQASTESRIRIVT
jgi:hypothetical protein